MAQPNTPALSRHRVWIEARNAGFIVRTNTDAEPLTVSPIALEVAEQIAIEYAERTGALYDLDAIYRTVG